MVSTTLIEPQVMDMQVPPIEGDDPVPESRVFNVYIGPDGSLLYSLGNETPQLLSIGDLQALAESINRERGNEVISNVRVCTGAKYGRLIDVLDELNQAGHEISANLSLNGITRERRLAFSGLSQEDWEQTLFRAESAAVR